MTLDVAESSRCLIFMFSIANVTVAEGGHIFLTATGEDSGNKFLCHGIPIRTGGQFLNRLKNRGTSLPSPLQQSYHLQVYLKTDNLTYGTVSL